MVWNGLLASRARSTAVGHWISVALFLCMIVSPDRVQGQHYEGTGHRVIDGDTIHLLRETGQIVRLTLYGIDAPEWGQRYGERAARAVRRAIAQKHLRVVAEDRDEDGRPLYLVTVGDDRSLNEFLLRNGLAWWDRQQAATEDRLRRLEHKARAAERGLWAQQDPVPPWTWRAQRSDGG